jgi:hypothetical protein
MPETELATIDQKLTPMDLLPIAIKEKAAIDVIERLAALQMQFTDREDKVSFRNAMTKFKAELPRIVRSRPIVDKQGAEKYKVVALEDVADPVMKALHRHGITYRFKSDMLPNGHIKVTCYLALQGTAFEEEGSTLAAPPDTSGGKDPLKAVGSTTSYLEKYTLMASVGMHVYGSDPESEPQTRPDDLLEESVVMDFVAAMDGSADEAQLKTNYQAAAKAGASDPSALKEFEKAKIRNWRRIHAK